MRITIIFLIIGYLLGCSGSGNPIAPTYPMRILGEYNGTVSYTGYSGTLYPESDSTEIEFNFLIAPTTTYCQKTLGVVEVGGVD